MTTLTLWLAETLPAGGDLRLLLALAAVYAIAAVFSGLAGFGFSAIGSLSLVVLPPQRGVALLMALSLITQMASLRSLWPDIRRHCSVLEPDHGLWPYLAGGCLGLPLGLWILTGSGQRPLLGALGLLLVGYASWSLLQPVRARPALARHWALRLGVGSIGGVVGGFSAFPGAALVVWNSLSGVAKEPGRAAVQVYILFMQVVALALLVATRPGSFDAAFFAVLTAAAPAALVGNRTGIALYRRTGDRGYRQLTLLALGAVGCGLTFKALH
jgi:uncharacterized membrane protein YfcA